MKTFLLILCLPALATAAAKPEVRGTWLTTTANEALSTPAHTADAMKRLRDAGLNTVYVECWKNGYTEFRSDTMLKATKVMEKINLPDQPKTRDLLLEATIEAHRNSLLCIAWFEYGLIAAAKGTTNELMTLHPQWLLRNKDGSEIAPDGSIWLNPLNPDVQKFVVSFILEAALNYDIDGVQLDDHFGWPDWSMGYDDASKAAYAKDHAGSPPPQDGDDPEWIHWRQEQLTKFAGELYQAVHKIRHNLLVSISPSPHPWSLEHHGVDWPTWAKNGWFDEFVPQIYRADFKRFASEWPAQIEAAGDRKSDLIAGLRINGSGANTPWQDLQKMVDLVRTSDAAGHCWWFSRGVLEDDLEQITAYYDVANHGQAPHPKHDENWRPPPIVADRHGMRFSLRVETPGDYEVIVQHDGVWNLLRTERLGPGTIEVSDKKYEAVELLKDHRKQ